jgi:PAT family beta-lactamase induction signal transducer AmpG
MKDFIMTFVDFFKKNDIGLALFFILTYRLGESQLVKISIPFLKDATEVGGLGLGNEHIGMIKGTVGVIALLLGGILGGICISKGGLKKWILPMALAINLPDLLYVYLAYAQPDNLWAIIGCVAGEQLGYGFGFTAFTLYLVYVAQGAFKTAHYSIGTGLMALGMMIPGMFAGKIQMAMGYPMFFIFVCICTLPGILASILVMRRIPASFGIKLKEEK